MNRQLDPFARVPAVVMFLIVAAMMIGPIACQSLYRTVVTLTEVMDSASKEYAKMFNDGLVPPDVASQVAVAHLEYRKSAAVLHDVLVAVKEGRDGNTEGAFIAAREAASRFIDVVALILTKDKTASLRTQLAKATKP